MSRRWLAALVGLAVLTGFILFAVLSDECTYSFWYVTTPKTYQPGCWILTTKWYVPKKGGN